MKLTRCHLFALAAISVMILGAGCSDRTPTDLPIARADIDPMVFDEQYDPYNVLYGKDAYFQPFSGTDPYSLKVDSLYASNGKLSIKISVPPDGSALGDYAGGVLTAVAGRDFADFNALTFKARTASISDVALDVAGFGNDNTGNSLFEAGRSGPPMDLGPEWTTFIVPIPDPSKLVSERGLFTFAEGWEEHPLGYDIWIDEIQFAKVSNITGKIPRLPPEKMHAFIGSTVSLSGTQTFFFMSDPVTITVDHSPLYFDYDSSDPSVAFVVGGAIKVVGEGTTNISAKLDTIPSSTFVEVNGYPPPTVAATPPTFPAEDVISMFSDVYSNVPVDTWRTDWSTGQVVDYVIAGDNTKMYTGLGFVGIEFLNPTIDATEMTHIHMDVYAPAGADFRVKLGSFPLDPSIDIIETSELILTPGTVPPFTSGAWVSLDIPLADFQINPDDLADWDWANMGLMVLNTNTNTTSPLRAPVVLVDNVFWHK